MLPDLLCDGPARGPLIALAHGAGAPMDSPFMSAFVEGLAGQGMRVVRFEFPYMAGRRTGGKRRPPDRQPVLLDTWRAVIDHFGADRLVIGGKSMGGRMASLVADEIGVRGLTCLGYPFYAAGKPDKPRVAHLETLNTPTLICQGERDTMGNREAIAGYRLSKNIRLHWLADGDHSFKPRKASGRTEAENWSEAIDAVAGFVRAC
ncbi:MAG: alpha/beta fold hydrolase [Alphaproteobacteria bacterium]